jgi:hypothetical protein
VTGTQVGKCWNLIKGPLALFISPEFYGWIG